MNKLLLDAELYKETAQSSPVLNEFVWNQGDLLNSSCSDEEEKQRDTSSLICIFQQFLLLNLTPSRKYSASNKATSVKLQAECFNIPLTNQWGKKCPNQPFSQAVASPAP